MSSNAPKRRGRKKGSVMPVTMEIVVQTSAVTEKMQWRLESLIEESTDGEILAGGETETGFAFQVRFENGPAGRLGRKAIASSLSKMKAKGSIGGATIISNIVRI